MPGSYRVLNHIIQHAPTLKVAKIPSQTPIESESFQSEDLNEGSQGKWSEQENLRFCIFVNYFQDIFSSKHKRKSCKIFKTFAEYLTSRSATQCRSHFQKMMEKHRSITKMKKYYKNLKGQTAYRRFFETFKSEWEQNHEPISKIHPEIREFKEFAIQTEPTPSFCSCKQKAAEVEHHILQSQIVPLPFWSETTSMQQMVGGNYFLWIPTDTTVLPQTQTNIQS